MPENLTEQITADTSAAGIINGNGILAVRVKLGKEDGVTNLHAETFFPLTLDEAREIVRSHDYH